jgi:hypothetical protein
MRNAVLFLMAVVVASPVLADEYRVYSQFPDFNGPHRSGALEPGTTLNPYIIENSRGERVGELRSQFPYGADHDGPLSAGSALNPYIFEDEDESDWEE